MKIKLLFFLLFGQQFFSYGQSIYINQINPTAVNGGINVNLLVTTLNGAGYLSHSYTVVGNTIDLSVCYWFDFTLPVFQINNDFLINVPNNSNYTINVSIINSSSQTTCDNYSNGPTETANYLDTDAFEKIKNDYSVYPNPCKEKIEFTGNELAIKKIEIYDNLGRLIKPINKIEAKSIDLKELIDGIYFIQIETEFGSFTQKVIVKK